MNILVIQNDPIVPVGQLSAFLGGHEVVRAWEDPQRLQDLAAAPLPGALILLGGRANAYDDEAWPWLEAERTLVRRCVAARIRVLGICLGAQLIAASAIGAAVGAAATWWRRLEIASALHAGFRTSDTTFLQLCEAVSWVGCAFVLTSAICLTILSGAPPSDRSDLMRLVATEGACAASWTLIGVAITAMVIRERQLFAFFKGR